jgi:hypothetical protein
MIDLEAEFWRAIRFAKATGIAFPFSNRVQWGCARVEFYANRLYEPDPAGKWLAFIAPVVEGGELIDLCAYHSVNNRTAQRFGYGKGLGLDVVEKARMRCADLRLVSTAADWLRMPVDAVYLFDIAKVAVMLDGVPSFTCDSIELAERVSAFLPPSDRSRVQLNG